ncbi:pyridoxamine 5'-phosphate oxidase family protein [Desulfosporosinus sp.]|uniref:pyridoxamine 5'-phosphate oxidase family protein n=1 Tax=Desulfosporosinus sp. TaxID=157907 RepID=UPI00260336AC|nr:pyridoxamine 5'-phosphate oxidase family protein [Desulfosporosinus sp.]MCO5388755.1 pyridoxamine 5'-phosphate oxidase family protein [Desulfosporosinus sp.]
MEEVLGFLKENRIGSLATVANGKPKVRPWGFMMAENGKFYFCTANTKDVYKQMKEIPFIEFTSTSKDMVTVRLSGEVIFISDLSIKEKILENNPNLIGMYKSADNPIFEVFYIEHGEIIIADFSGQPPKKISF